jgi:hypothetical protein
MSVRYGYKHHGDVQEELKQRYFKNEGKSYYQDVYKLECVFCGNEFYCCNFIARYCSYRCTNDAYIARRKERKSKERQKICPVCNEQYQAKRKDSIYCSPACRQKQYRERNR